MKIVIIGATTGIGRSLAQLYASKGHEIAITGRRIALLEEIKDTFLNTKIHMVVTVSAIDKKADTVTLAGPHGRTVTVSPRDPKILKHLKVGKTVVLDYTSLRIIKLDPITAK